MPRTFSHPQDACSKFYCVGAENTPEGRANCGPVVNQYVVPELLYEVLAVTWLTVYRQLHILLLLLLYITSGALKLLYEFPSGNLVDGLPRAA